MNFAQGIVFLFFIIVTWASENNQNDVSSAEIQSCRGCALNRLPEVKAFIYEDVPNYENVVFKPIPGAPPELVLYNSNQQEVERISLREKSRKECNSLLTQWGFSLKPTDKVPEISEKQEL